MRRSSVVLFHTIVCAPGKREKETKFSFSLLNLPSFLSVVRRFPYGKLHGHTATAGIRVSRCQVFVYG